MPIINFRATGFQRNLPPIEGVSDIAFSTSSNIFQIQVKNDPLNNPIAVVNDILRLKGFNGTTILDNWLLVTGRDTSSAGYSSYTVTRQSGTAGLFPAGTAVVNYKQANQGWIYQTADDSDGPFFSVRTHAGAPWTTQTEQLRIGNLRNTFDYGATPTYGFSAGQYGASSGKSWVTIDPTNGVRVGKDDKTRISMNAAGVLTINDSTGTARFTADASGNLTMDGILKMLGSTSAIAIGTTPPTSANLGTGIWLDRTGLYGLASGTQNFKLDATTGGITAIAGSVGGWTINSNSLSGTNVTLSPTGLVLVSDISGNSYITWKSGSTYEAGITVNTASGVNLVMDSAGSTQLSAVSGIKFSGTKGEFPGTNVIMGTYIGGTSPRGELDVRGTAYLDNLTVLNHTGAGFATATISGSLTINSGGLNVGTATGAGTGIIKSSDSIQPGVSGLRFKTYQLVLANNAAAQLISDNTSPTGWVFIMDANSVYGCLCFPRLVNGVVIVNDTNAQYSNAAGTAAKRNVYWSVGNTRTELENKSGAQVTFYIWYLGT